MRRSQASRVSGDSLCRCQACTVWGGGIFVRRLSVVLGSPLDRHPLPRPETAGIQSADNTNSVPLGRLFGNRGTGKQPARRGRKLFGPGNFPARGLPSPRPARPPSPGPAPTGTAESPVSRERRGRLLDGLEQLPPPRVTQIPFGRWRERGANSPGRSGSRGRGGAAALQREPTNFRRRPAGIAWWPG